MGSAFAGPARCGTVARSTGCRCRTRVVGAAEDAIVLCLVALATRDRAPEAAADAAERAAARGGRVAAGVAATAVGTAAMTAAQAAAPASRATRPGEVGRRLLEGVFGRRVRRRERGPLNHAMHWLYGTSWGVGLGAAHRRRRRAAARRADRAWRSAPACGPRASSSSRCSASRRRRGASPRAIATDVGFHLVYGVATAAALAVLRRTPD